MNIKEIRKRLVVRFLPLLENYNRNKHVETVWSPGLDAGSTPASSTLSLDNHLIIQERTRFGHNLFKTCLFFVDRISEILVNLIIAWFVNLIE